MTYDYSDTAVRNRHQRALGRALEDATETPAFMIADRIGCGTPSTGWGTTALRSGWATGVAVVSDLAPTTGAERIEWLMGGIDDDDIISPAVAKRVRESLVFRDQTALDTAFLDLVVESVDGGDRDEMTEFEYAERAVAVVLELAAHTAVEAVLTEYRRHMSPKGE